MAGSEFDLPLSVAVIAIGTSANPIVQSTTPGLGTNKRGYIQADENTQKTTRQGVFAGGDIVTGSTTVILAMGAGRRAAKSIHEYLTTGVPRPSFACILRKRAGNLTWGAKRALIQS